LWGGLCVRGRQQADQHRDFHRTRRWTDYHHREFGRAVSAPFNLTLDAFSPGLATSGANNVNLYLADSFTPVPAVNSGDFVVAYAFGLGQTKPPLATGMPTPADALCATAPQLTIGDLAADVVLAAVSVTIGGLDAPVASASQAPGMAGICLVASVPDGVMPDDRAQVVLTAGTRSSHPVTMAVQQPADGSARGAPR
jgi:hypothetical protein